MAQQMARQRLGVRRDVEQLVRRDARVGARRDVADRVAARLARRQARARQTPHCRVHVVQLHEVKLQVLTRRHVAEAARVVLGDARQLAKLQAVEHALRDLDAQHLRVALLALAVGATGETERAPRVRVDLAALEPFEHGDELVDIGLTREREARAAERPGIVDG